MNFKFIHFLLTLFKKMLNTTILYLTLSSIHSSSFISKSYSSQIESISFSKLRIMNLASRFFYSPHCSKYSFKSSEFKNILGNVILVNDIDLDHKKFNEQVRNFECDESLTISNCMFLKIRGNTQNGAVRMGSCDCKFGGNFSCENSVFSQCAGIDFGGLMIYASNAKIKNTCFMKCLGILGNQAFHVSCDRFEVESVTVFSSPCNLKEAYNFSTSFANCKLNCKYFNSSYNMGYYRHSKNYAEPHGMIAMFKNLQESNIAYFFVNANTGRNGFYFVNCNSTTYIEQSQFCNSTYSSALFEPYNSNNHVIILENVSFWDLNSSNYAIKEKMKFNIIGNVYAYGKKPGSSVKTIIGKTIDYISKETIKIGENEMFNFTIEQNKNCYQPPETITEPPKKHSTKTIAITISLSFIGIVIILIILFIVNQIRNNKLTKWIQFS